jgi:hypothetical protein
VVLAVSAGIPAGGIDAPAWRNGVILNPASQPEFGTIRGLFHAHSQGGATQIGYTVGVERTMCGHHNIALEALAGPYRLIHGAIEAIPADITGFGSQWVPGAIASQIQGPVESCPRTSASFHACLPRRLVGA